MKERIARLIDYMTAREALAQGFTNEGAMYGVPCWIGDVDSTGPMVSTKWGPMEHFISLGHLIMGFMQSIRGDEPHFAIQIGAEIKR